MEKCFITLTAGGEISERNSESFVGSQEAGRNFH
jgi:hypothetical protein